MIHAPPLLGFAELPPCAENNSTYPWIWIRCPLCKSEKTHLLEEIPAHLLADAYRRIFGYAPTNEFANVPAIAYRHCGKCDLRFFYPPVAGGESLYDALRARMGSLYYMQEKPEYDVARRWINEGEAVLDVGCGVGAFAAAIPNARYTGLELNSGAIAEAKRVDREVIQDTIEEHSAKHRSQYDVVCSFQVLEHVSDVHGFLAGCLRTLKTGGMLITCVPSFDSFLRFQPNALLNLPPHHLSHWSDRCLGNVDQLFPLRLEAIEHELLADIHRDSYAATLVTMAIRRAPRLLDTSMSNRLIMRVCGRIGRVLSRGLQVETMRPRGHSVLAIHRKVGEVG
jgi:SAM-dependent methyltransferase